MWQIAILHNTSVTTHLPQHALWLSKQSSYQLHHCVHELHAPARCAAAGIEYIDIVLQDGLVCRDLLRRQLAVDSQLLLRRDALKSHAITQNLLQSH